MTKDSAVIHQLGREAVKECAEVLSYILLTKHGDYVKIGLSGQCSSEYLYGFMEPSIFYFADYSSSKTQQIVFNNVP